MHIKQILVVKETREGEFRVALTPEAVTLLVSKQYRLLVESGAGLNAGFNDSDYVKAGAEIFLLTPEGFPSDTLILRVKRAIEAREVLENKYFHKNTFVMGFLSPCEVGNHVAEWQSVGVTTFSLDLFKKLSIDDPRNVQAAMSRIAGRLAFQDALKHYTGNQELQLTVLGTGPAAFSAALEAREHGVPVQLFGRQEHYRAKAEQAGVKYYVFPNSSNQAGFLRSYLSNQTIIIAAARTPREKAPLLVDKDNLNVLPKNAVVIDLAVSEGGNVAGSKRDQVITVTNDVMIVNISGYPKGEPKAASEAYANCLVNLLADVMSSSGEILFEHELLSECWVTHNEQRNPSLLSQNDDRIIIKPQFLNSRL